MLVLVICKVGFDSIFLFEGYDEYGVIKWLVEDKDV